MTDSDHQLCPDCGWTGERSELEDVDGDYQCPVCAETVVVVE